MDYRRMGNMELNVGNTSATSSDQWRHLWKSPRWIVLRIESLVLVAIIISFFLAAFGSCRRWSNHWIAQKGFFAAQALSLSLGTYGIGLMQSSSVKSEMYPIWTVSLFTLFGCIDPVTSYNGLDYKGPLTKMVYGIFLYCGYVLLMSISTMSSDVRSTAIIVLSAITSIKGVHRSLALVQQSRMRSMLQELDVHSGNFPLRREELSGMVVDLRRNLSHGRPYLITLYTIEKVLAELKDERLSCCYDDVCVAFSLSHELQRHVLGFDWEPKPCDLKDINYKWAMRVIEIELAFLYESFFTGNPFFYYYQAKTTCFWALASFIGICFMGIAVAVPTHGAMVTSRHHGDGGSTCTNVVETTTADLVITCVVLVSLALLQLMHLIQGWTSNWARVAVACARARNQLKLTNDDDHITQPHERMAGSWQDRWLMLKMSVATSSNWFDKCLWQGKIGQCFVLRDGRLLSTGTSTYCLCRNDDDEEENAGTNSRRDTLVKMLGLDYISEVVRDLLGSDTNTAGVRLDDDIKEYVFESLGHIQTNRLDDRWLRITGITSKRLNMLRLLFEPEGKLEENPTFKDYIKWVMAWQAVTWLCQIAEAEQEKQQDAVNESEQCEEGSSSSSRQAAAAVAGGERDEINRDRRVAIAVSNYCTYLVVSAPELLPGSASPDTGKRVFLKFVKMVRTFIAKKGSVLQGIQDLLRSDDKYDAFREEVIFPEDGDVSEHEHWTGVFVLLVVDIFRLGVRHRWKAQSILWVQLLLFAAPYGNVEAHMRHLAQGGEFITHLWALFYHLGISKWKPWVTYLHNITTVEEATIILEGHGFYNHAVVAYVNNLTGSDSDELAKALSMESSSLFCFYQTTNPDVANLFKMDRIPSLVFLNKADKGKFTSYDREFRAYQITCFVRSNMDDYFAKQWPQHTAPSIFQDPIQQQACHTLWPQHTAPSIFQDPIQQQACHTLWPQHTGPSIFHDPIKQQGWEDRGQTRKRARRMETEDEIIEEEILPPMYV